MKINTPKYYRLKNARTGRYVDFQDQCEVRNISDSTSHTWDEIVVKCNSWNTYYGADSYVVVESRTGDKVHKESHHASQKESQTNS